MTRNGVLLPAVSCLAFASARAGQIPDYRAELREVAPIEDIRFIRKIVFSRS